MALTGAQLVNSFSHKFPESHERVRREAGGVCVVGVSGVFGSPFLEEYGLCPPAKAIVGASYEWGGELSVPGGGGA